MTDEVRLAVSGGVAYVTIDRPKVLNALDPRSTQRLNEIWDEIELSVAERNASSVRCVVITGVGRAFCTGADMSAAAVDKSGLEYWADLDPHGFGGLSLRRTLDVPVIARVNGYALGGGMELALGADIVLAAEGAKFGLTEPRVGRLPLDGGMVLLQRKMPHNKAMGMLLTGRKVSASELERWGLVNAVVPEGDLDAEVNRWVEDILACAPPSLRAIKALVNQTAHLSAAEARSMRLSAVIDAVQSDDSLEGVRAFQEKRSPVWSGR